MSVKCLADLHACLHVSMDIALVPKCTRAWMHAVVESMH